LAGCQKSLAAHQCRRP